MVGIGFHGEYWFGLYYKCNSILTDNNSTYLVYCNSANKETTFMIPDEGTKQCVQVSKLAQGLI